MKKVALQKDEGKPQLSLKRQAEQKHRRVQALISSLDSQDVDCSAFSSRKQQQQFDPYNDRAVDW